MRGASSTSSAHDQQTRHFLPEEFGGPILAHEVVVLVLDRAGLDRNLDAKILEALWQVLRPQHGEVWLRSRPEVIECMQHTEAGGVLGKYPRFVGGS